MGISDYAIFPIQTKLSIKWDNGWYEAEVASVCEQMTGPNTAKCHHRMQYAQDMVDGKDGPQSLIWQDLETICGRFWNVF